MTAPTDNARIIHATPIPRVRDAFRWWVRRMVKREFNAVRVSQESERALASLRGSDRPHVVAMNHQSWWDPIIGLVLSRELCRERPGLAPMDREMLERFGIFRKVCAFGIDPDDPGSLPAMCAYVGGFFRDHPDGALWLTPQGEFADPRAPVRLRPGAAAIATDTEGVRVVSVAIEYVFWLDKHPEVLLHASLVEPPEEPSVASWHRALTRAMRSDNGRLAQLATARDPARFTPLLDSGGGGTSFIYNLWLRLRGKRTDLASERTGTANTNASLTDGRTA